MQEVWKDIKDYEGLYQVSNRGRIRSLDRVTIDKEGRTKGRTRHFKGKILVGTPDKDGYLRLKLCKDGSNKIHAIHRLVAEAFIPNPENKETVDHINTNITDNRVENLRWFTRHEQISENEITNERIKKVCGDMGKRYWKKAMETRKKKVLCVETNTIYESAAAAARAYNLFNNSPICECCNGKRKTVAGCHWKYYE